MCITDYALYFVFWSNCSIGKSLQFWVTVTFACLCLHNLLKSCACAHTLCLLCRFVKLILFFFIIIFLGRKINFVPFVLYYYFFFLLLLWCSSSSNNNTLNNYLVSILDEWENFLERIGRGESAGEVDLQENSTDFLELRFWASYRGQTLARTG